MCIADVPPARRAQSLRAAHAKRLRPTAWGAVSSVAIATRLPVTLEAASMEQTIDSNT
ncbi:MAG TPA: hypothetical protein VFN02_16770 [Ktedonobacteraceae bacterium]|nr:hypothetical protein [Ktedonobacteraceae bacterium]